MPNLNFGKKNTSHREVQRHHKKIYRCFTFLASLDYFKDLSHYLYHINQGQVNKKIKGKNVNKKKYIEE